MYHNHMARVVEHTNLVIIATVICSCTVLLRFKAITRFVMPNTHRRRDSTVELRHVGVGGVNKTRN